MTANDASASGAGASSRAAQMWDQANWPHIEAEVKRLQVRIAKAERQGRKGGKCNKKEQEEKRESDPIPFRSIGDWEFKKSKMYERKSKEKKGRDGEKEGN